jgi:hypothetical protein
MSSDFIKTSTVLLNNTNSTSVVNLMKQVWIKSHSFNPQNIYIYYYDHARTITFTLAVDPLLL